MISYQTIAKNITTLFTHPVKANFVVLETGNMNLPSWGGAGKRSCQQLDQLHTANFGFC